MKANEVRPRGRAFPPPPLTLESKMNMAVPAMPAVIDRAEELCRHLVSLENNLAVIRARLFGDCNDPSKEPEPPMSLEGMVEYACHRAACCVGDTATIIDRLGVPSGYSAGAASC